jgi:hypothetical protein
MHSLAIRSKVTEWFRLFDLIIRRNIAEVCGIKQVWDWRNRTPGVVVAAYRLQHWLVEVLGGENRVHHD